MHNLWKVTDLNLRIHKFFVKSSNLMCGTKFAIVLPFQFVVDYLFLMDFNCLMQCQTPINIVGHHRTSQLQNTLICLFMNVQLIQIFAVTKTPGHIRFQLTIFPHLSLGHSASVLFCLLLAIPTTLPFLWNSLKSKSKSHYDRQSVGQSVLVSCAHLGPATNFFLLEIFF
jgi:hypothetical protein